MLFLAAALALAALYLQRRGAAETVGPAGPPPAPTPPANVPPAGGGGARWSDITESGVKFQILARREVLIHWFNTLWQWPTDSVPDRGNLMWEKEDLTGGVVTRVSVNLTPENMRFRITRLKGEEIQEDNQYLIKASTIAKAIQTHDTKWFNGVVIWAGFYLDIIVRLQ